jgi:hypothetical protein
MEGTAKIPKTADDALKAWDAGDPISAFHVEAEDSEQVAIYAAAFDILAGRELKPGLTDREIDVAKSIASVALERGWARMVREHTQYTGPRATHMIDLQNPETEKK